MTADADRDVVVVGGGPAGSAVGVFTARYGLQTTVFDRGRSSLRQCAFVENYPGFPAGVDVETLYELFHEHAREAGCSLVPDLVTAVRRRDDGPGFVVEPQDADPVTARRVVAATRYDGEYLRPVDDGSLFESVERHGETAERIDRSCADETGATAIEGLYVASPSEAADRQAIVAAGRGARVGLEVVEAVRRERSYPDAVSKHRDWLRREDGLDEEWRSRDRWREWFDDRLPDDHDLTEERRIELREREIDRVRTACRTDEWIEAATERGQRRLLDCVDDELIVERASEIRAGLGVERVSD